MPINATCRTAIATLLAVKNCEIDLVLRFDEKSVKNTFEKHVKSVEVSHIDKTVKKILPSKLEFFISNS